MLDFIVEKIDAHTTHVLEAILNSEKRIMTGQEQILAALTDLKTDLNTTLTDLETAVTDAVKSGDPAAALAMIADMKQSVDTAELTVKPAAADPAATTDPTTTTKTTT